MQSFSVILDANVLYSATLRDTMMWLSLTNLFKAKWTDHIHREWITALAKRGYDSSKLERVQELMDQHALDAKVTGYESLIPSLTLPDPDDRHVLAAAIRSHADAIVTFDLKHFPEQSLAPYDIEVIHPDDFIIYQIEISPQHASDAFKRQRTTKSRPSLSVDDMLRQLRRCGLPQTAQTLEQYRNLI